MFKRRGLAEIVRAHPFPAAACVRGSVVARSRSFSLKADFDCFSFGDIDILVTDEAHRTSVPCLDPQELSLCCQPIVDLRFGEVHCHELLLRVGGERPGPLLEVASRLGFIDQLDRWVIGRAAGSRERFSVNVSGASLNRIDSLGIERLPAGTIVEITEQGDRSRVLMEETVAKLQRMGLRVALDDYGDGHHTSDLLGIPFDWVKLRMGSRYPARMRTVRSSHSDLVSEMIDSPQRLQAAISAGSRYGQGFLLGPPKSRETAFRGLRL